MGDSQHDAGDSDSDWDSTLDFTSPRQSLQPGGQPRIEFEDENSQATNNEHPKPRERLSLTNSIQNEGEISEQIGKDKTARQVDSGRKNPQQSNSKESQGRTNNQNFTVEESPPYNFREAVHGSAPSDEKLLKPPGKGRKGTAYDPSAAQTPRGLVPSDSFKSTSSWDDSDAEEKTLRELRETFNREKVKEQATKENQQKQNPANDTSRLEMEEPLPTNRSETTSRSWANMGNKFGRKNNGEENASVPVSASVSRESRQAQRTEYAPSQGRPYSGEMSFVAEKYQMPSEIPGEMGYHPDTPPGSPNQTQMIVKDDIGNRYIYYFGRGNLKYFEAEDTSSSAFLPQIADKVEKIARRVWQEVFAALRIITSVIIWFLVELIQYLSRYIIQPLLLGFLVTLGDFIIKPFLSTVFNAFLQPASIFLWNTFASLRHVFGPIGDILKRVFEQLAMLCHSIRLVEINWPPPTQRLYREVHNI